MARYEAQQYWDALLGRHLDERGVGYQDLPLAFNRAMYTAELQATSKLLTDHRLATPARVLDIGSGTGIWVDFWRERGAGEIVGLDLTELAVTNLRRRYPDLTFLQADIGAETLSVMEQFDTVSAMSVLLHITDEERWRRALVNIASALRPGGHAILIEPVLAHAWWGEPFDENSNSRARPLSAYQEACRLAGLEIVDVRPATVLLANPIDARTELTFRMLARYWEVVRTAVRGRESRGRLVGAVLSRLDRPLRWLLPNGPTAKLLLLQRR